MRPLPNLIQAGIVEVLDIGSAFIELAYAFY